MATTFKNFLSNDLANTRTLLHEAIPITGSIVSGTYAGDGNIKTYGHGIFKSVYDYPYLSSSANHIFDITAGYSNSSVLSSSANTQHAKKINIYNQMAQYLVGYDETGSVKRFKMPTNDAFMDNCVFIPFARLLSKDEIKKGSVAVELGLSAAYAQDRSTFGIRGKLIDYSGSNGYYVDSPAGEYGVLYATSSNIDNISSGTPVFSGETLGSTTTMPAVGLIYYQAGVAVITGSIFNDTTKGGVLSSSVGTVALGASAETGFDFISGSTLDAFSTGVLTRVYNVSFNNTTELNSTIYFCRASHSDFNYSSNPTYLSGSQIRVKTRSADAPVSYITTVGLYSADNELLAVAKLSEPLRKDPTNEITLRVRLDY
tara:strand:- start:1126 stop:2241 length:1116 start_codon:yes stop_codon:yes gene_type:complete